MPYAIGGMAALLGNCLWAHKSMAVVAKGGISVQLCGWLAAFEMWMGAISDSEYLERSGILEEQRLFALVNKISGKIIAFTNVLN